MYIETDPRWSAPDIMATENEVSYFLGALVRLLKPKIVIETGCYKGHTTRAIGEALFANQGDGYLHSCDNDLDRVVECKDSISSDLPIQIDHCTGLNLISKYEEEWEAIDLAFIDSGDDATRLEECLALNMSPGGLIVLHDARRSTYQSLVDLGWKSWFIPTPRGLAVFFR